MWAYGRMCILGLQSLSNLWSKFDFFTMSWNWIRLCMVLCGYIILIYPKVKVYTNFQFIYLMGKGIL
jgi:hypothetical protein